MDSTKITWDDMLKAQERIKIEGYKLTKTAPPSKEEYEDAIDKFKSKVQGLIKDL